MKDGLKFRTFVIDLEGPIDDVIKRLQDRKTELERIGAVDINIHVAYSASEDIEIQYKSPKNEAEIIYEQREQERLREQRRKEYERLKQEFEV